MRNRQKWDPSQSWDRSWFWDRQTGPDRTICNLCSTANKFFHGHMELSSAQNPVPAASPIRSHPCFVIYLDDLESISVRAAVVQITSWNIIAGVQGDHSGCARPPVDIKMNVAFQYMLLIQGDNSTCSKLPVDFKTKVPLWPGKF